MIRSHARQRSTASEVMKQILSDVQTAIDLFPETNILDKTGFQDLLLLCLKAEALAWKYTVQAEYDKNDLTERFLHWKKWKSAV